MLPWAREGSRGTVFLQAAGFSVALRDCTLLCSEIYTGSCNLVWTPWRASWLSSCVLWVSFPDPRGPKALNTAAGPSPAPCLSGPAPVPPQPRPHQGSWLKLHGHVLQEGHEMGRAPLHLIQVLELVVLFLGVLRGGEGSETEGSSGGAWGLIPAPLPGHLPQRTQAGGWGC